jgi:hypothetical protein
MAHQFGNPNRWAHEVGHCTQANCRIISHDRLFARAAGPRRANCASDTRRATSTPRRRTRSPRRGEGCNKVTMSRVLMYELFAFQTLVDREAPNVEQEPVTMIQHDQRSRWKAWMRMLAVDIRPISMSMLRESTSLSIGVTRPGVLSAAMRPSLRRPELRRALIPPARRTRQ